MATKPRPLNGRARKMSQEQRTTSFSYQEYASDTLEQWIREIGDVAGVCADSVDVMCVIYLCFSWRNQN